MALLNSNEYRAFTNISTTQLSDIQLDALCESCSKAVESYCKRSFEKTTLTDIYCGTGNRVITLKRRPVVSITSVYYDPRGYFGSDTINSFGSETLLVQGTDYCLDSRDTGFLIRITGDWPEYPRRREWFKLSRDLVPNFGDVKVTYVGGYDPVPFDVKLATAQLVTRSIQMLRYGGPLEREHLGDWSYKIMDPILGTAPDLASVRSLLAKYKEFPW